jgi:oligosaccharide reducing-end xylanase
MKRASIGVLVGIVSTSCGGARCGDGASAPANAAAQTATSRETGVPEALLSAGARATGKYRNVFAEHGKAQADIEQKLKSAYDTYFSTSDANRLYYQMGADLAYVKDTAHEDIRSEGQSYAMMITLQRNDQAKFNKLWRFAHEKMRIAKATHPNYRGFAWVVDTEGRVCDENSAPDGEEYFAMALYFAHNRWGSASGTGYDNYKYWADELLDVMKNRPSISGMRSRRVDAGSDDGKPCTGNMSGTNVTSVPLFDAKHKLIRFDATTGSDFSDPSYHLPAFYELFAEWGPPADAEFWKAAAGASRQFLARAMNPKTGLAPEYADYDGSPHRVPWNENSGKFAYDAWRVGGNIGMDAAWIGAPGPTAAARADALVAFFHSQGPSSYKALWNLDGTGGSGSHSAGLVAMNAVATLATTSAVSSQAAALVEDFWSTPLPTGMYRYYDGLLYTFALLHLSGEYAIYAPR